MNSRTASKTTDQFILAPHPTQISVVKLFQIFLKNGPFSASFFFIFVFSILLTVNVQYKFLPMTGFEQQTSGLDATALLTEPQPLPQVVSNLAFGLIMVKRL